MRKVDIIRYISGEASEQERKEVLRWILKSRKNQSYYLFLRNLWTISSISSEEPVIKESRAIIRKPFMLVACFVALLIIGAVFIFSPKNSLLHGEVEEIVSFCSNDGKIKVLNMADGSRLVMNINSEISYSKNFGIDNRDLFVTGEVLFEIAKNDKLPMVVRTKSGESVRVVGTKFIINTAFEENCFSAYLIDGKVCVSIPDSEFSGGYKEISLNREEMVVVSKDKRIRVDTLSNSTSLLSWKDKWLHFENQPLSLILERLGEYYGVKFIYSEEIGNILMTINIMDDKLEDFLSILSDCIGIGSRCDKKNISLF